MLSDLDRAILTHGGTYSALCAAYSPDESDTRAVDKALQKLRRKGRMLFKRDGRKGVRSATDEGRAELQEGTSMADTATLRTIQERREQASGQEREMDTDRWEERREGKRWGSTRRCWGSL